jgi:transcriptional repressor NrdR
MRCPFCAAPETRVTDSRIAGDGDQVRRRRECLACGARFTTYEKVELLMPRVVKSDGSREPFEEGKLRTGMLRALEKRPVETEAVEAAVARIMRKLRANGEREVSSRVIGGWVMDILRDLDEVAYVRFASVYRRFDDAADFRAEVERLERAPPPDLERQQLSLLPLEPVSPSRSGPRGGQRRTARRPSKPKNASEPT